MDYSAKYVFSAKCAILSAFRHRLLKSKLKCDSLRTKEVRHMANEMQPIAKLAKSVAEKALKRDANQTTCSIFYQPKAPKELDRFKKNKV